MLDNLSPLQVSILSGLSVLIIGGIGRYLINKIIIFSRNNSVKKKRNIKLNNTIKNINVFIRNSIEKSNLTTDLFDNFFFPDVLYNKKKYNNIIDIIINNYLNYEIIAGGGGGKTVSLLYIAKYFIKKYMKYKIIPFYIELHDINQLKTPNNFIKKYIIEHYLYPVNINIDNDELDIIVDQFCKTIQKKKYKVFLLLDGFNEINKFKDEINIELRDLIKQKNFKCIITSRYDIKKDIFLELEKIELTDFSMNTLNILFKYYNMNFVIDERLKLVIKNPMMFTIYKKLITTTNDKKLDIKNIQSQTSLLNKYLSYDNFSININSNIDMHLICTSILLPKIGNEMEKNDRYEINDEELKDHIYAVINYIFNNELSTDIIEIRERFKNNYYKNDCLLKDQLLIDIKNYLNQTSGLLIKKINYNESYYYFQHQIFRDYFSSIYIYESIKNNIEKSDLIFRDFPIAICINIAEMYEEYDCVYNWYENYTNSILYNSNLAKLLNYLNIDKCNELSIDSNIAIKNILNMIKTARNGLFCLKILNVDLSKYFFNGILISRHINGVIIGSTEIKNCIIDYKKYLPQGHYQWVFGITVYNEYIISGGRDGFVKVWREDIEYCISSIKISNVGIRFIKTILINSQEIIICIDENNIIYTVNIETLKYFEIIILSKKIKQLKVYFENTNEILISFIDGTLAKILFIDDKNASINYLENINISINTFCIRNNEKIIAITNNGEIINLNITTNENRKISIENNQINDIIISNDDSFIFYSCNRGIIKYNLNKQVEEKIYYIPDNSMPGKICLNKNQNKILAAYNNDSIIEWEIDSGNSIYNGCHDDLIEDICYFDNDKKSISGSRDFSIKVTNLITNQPEQIYRGVSFWIKRFVINENIVYLPSNDSTIKKYDINKNTPIDFIEGHEKRIYSIDKFINKNIIVSASLDKKIGIWDIEKWENITFSDYNLDCMDDVVIIDQNLFASIDSSNNVYLWLFENNILTCKSIKNESIFNKITHKAVGANAIYFLKNIYKLASLHWDGSINLWNITKNELDFYKKIHDSDNWQYCIKEYNINNENILVACGKDGKIRIYTIEHSIILKKCIENLNKGSIYQFDSINNYLYFATGVGTIISLDISSNIYNWEESEKIHDGRIFAIVANPKESSITTYSEDGYVVTSNVNRFNVIKTNNKIKYVQGLLIKGVSFESNITTNQDDNDDKNIVHSYI